MARAVDVGIVAVLGLVFQMPGIDSDTAGFLFRCVVDVVELEGLVSELAGAVLGDGGAERRLSVVDVSDRTNVHMKFSTFEFFFGHIGLLLGFVTGSSR
ncbi:MAG: Uncharacterized protein FD137_859 [Spirochaetes bacterium]|nr:MAG: Uncharacterized protein FD137_859 [Spirochaetota bacterium]